jgi:hypothetical protein
MKHAHVFPALLFAAALMSGPAAGNESAGGTMVISAETICAQQPDSAFCQSQPAAASRPAAAQSTASYGTMSDRQSTPYAPSIQVLEARAPWMNGYIRWCEAFPQHASC